MHADALTRVTRTAFPSRREFMIASAAGAIATAAMSRSVHGAAAASATSRDRDYASRESFDALEPQWNVPLPANNESGQLGWGRAYLLQAYVLMYRTYGDTHYLDRLIEDFDRMLQLRDSVRGATDYRGLSLPAWQCKSDYTCGSLILKDAQGRPTLQIRTGIRPADLCSATVSAGTRAGTFKLVVRKDPPAKKGADAKPAIDTFDDLTMDARSADYAPKRINGAFEKLNGAGPSAMVTAKDIRATREAASDATDVPAAMAATKFEPLGYVYAVQTGQITNPVAAFVRLVHETPALQAKYADKAAEYLDAIVAATDIFDYEWRQEGELGWYVWAKGCPIPFDGCEQAHNQYLSLGRTIIQLAAIAPDAAAREKYRDRAIRMSRTLKSDLKPAANGGVVWPYFWSKGWGYRGWKAADDVSEYQPTYVLGKGGDGHKETEDTSHGQLDVEFVLLSHANKLGVFDDADMQRLATTFSKTIVTRNAKNDATVFDHVDGTGKKGTYDVIAACWSPLAKWDRSIFETMRGIYNAKQPKVGAVSLPLGIAHLNAAARRAGG